MNQIHEQTQIERLFQYTGQSHGLPYHTQLCAQAERLLIGMPK